MLLIFSIRLIYYFYKVFHYEKINTGFYKCNTTVYGDFGGLFNGFRRSSLLEWLLQYSTKYINYVLQAAAIAHVFLKMMRAHPMDLLL